MRINEIITKEFAPTKTAKQVAYNAQADAHFGKVTVRYTIKQRYNGYDWTKCTSKD